MRGSLIALAIIALAGCKPVKVPPSTHSPVPSATLVPSPTASPSSAASPIPSANPSPTQTPFLKLRPLPKPSDLPTPLANVARTADSFVDSVGVDSHFNYTNTTYFLHFDAVKANLVASGIRHIRDGNITTNSGPYFDKLMALGALGINHSLGMAKPTDTAAMIVTALRAHAPYVDMIEPPNEIDGLSAYNVPGVFPRMLANQAMLYATTKAEPSAANVLVLGPANVIQQSYFSLGNLDPIVDNGNLHFATCSLNPGNNTASGHGGFPFADAYVRLSISKPIVNSEVGYSDALNVRPCGIDDKTIAKYAPRLIAERFNAGDKRTYFYQLADAPTDPVFGNTGLLDAVGNPKPQWTALTSLLHLVADPGPSFVPAPLAFSIANAPSDVHHTVLAHRDGSYDLLLWREIGGWVGTPTNIGGVPAVNAPVTVAVNVPATMTPTLYAYDSAWLLQPTVLAPSATQSISVSDSVSVLHLAPAP